MKNKLFKISPTDTERAQAGFTLTELLMVMIIIAIMSGIAVMYLFAYQKPYKPIDQALRIADLLQEAKQRALTQRESIRVEINLTNRSVRIIDENSPATATDDRLIRTVALLEEYLVKIGPRPNNITVAPPDPLVAPTALFTASVYSGGSEAPGSTGDNVCTIRFQSDGRVLNAGTNATGSNATLASSTIYMWQPKTDSPNESTISLAMSIVGTTGAMRLWEWDSNNVGANKWQDSRRTSNW